METQYDGISEVTMTPRALTYASREDWLRARKGGIGASEVAGLLGVSKWTTPYAIWAEKVSTDIDLDRPMSDRQRWGLALEDKIAEAWTDDQWEQAIEREARRRLGREKATKRWAEKNRQQKGATV